MSRLILILFVGLAGCSTWEDKRDAAASAEYVEWPDFDAEKRFGPLSGAQAKPLGKRLAEEDFKAGYYRILYYGLYSDPSKPERRLYKIYGVRGYSIAGCEVTDGLVEGADSYNATMRILLNERFGKDIFKESGFE